MVFSLFFILSLNFAIRSWWSEPKSAPSLIFCRVYRASPSSTANNIINWVSVLTIRWCPCMKLPLVFLEKSVCYHQCILLAKLLASVLFHFVLQDLICLFLQVSLYFLLLHSNPLKWKWHLFFFFGVSSKKVL